MDYRIKLIATWGLETIPFKDFFYFVMQKYITKSLTISDQRIQSYQKYCDLHLNSFYKFNSNPPESLLDFGCGWILAFPLLMTKYCKNVVACDLEPLARCEINSEVKKKLNISLDKIEYIVPCDIANTNFKDKSFDLITSNSVLEHIPRKNMSKVAQECYRLLTDNGICSFHVAHKDHWAHGDSKLHPMNYLKYSESQWKYLNPPLNFQNRMLQSEYISIFEKAGFKYQVDSTFFPCNLKVNDFFKNCKIDDFEKTHSHFIFYK